MQEILLAPPYLMAILGLLSGVIMFSKGQLENGYSRIILALWFMIAQFQPNIDSVTQRIVGRWVVAAILFVEISSYFMLWYFRRKYKKILGWMDLPEEKGIYE